MGIGKPNGALRGFKSLNNACDPVWQLEGAEGQRSGMINVAVHGLHRSFQNMFPVLKNLSEGTAWYRYRSGQSFHIWVSLPNVRRVFIHVH